MSRFVTAMLLTVAVLLSNLGTGVAAVEAKGPVISITGTLEVSNLSAPHYEVNGYVLIHTDATQLKSLAGQLVEVVGRESKAPSIYMRPLLVVDRVAPAKPGEITLPVLPPAEGGTKPLPPTMKPLPPKERIIILPVLPAPGDEVRLPVVPKPEKPRVIWGIQFRGRLCLGAIWLQ